MTPLDHARLAAAANDVDFEQLVVIQDTNNVVAWLEPTSVIVKVGRWSHSAPALQLEYAVARQLADLDAPVAAPVGVPFTDARTSMVSTLWTRLNATHEPADADPRILAGCLATVHAALTDVTVEMPDFRDGVDLAARTLFNDVAMNRMAYTDRDLLRACYEPLRSGIDDISMRVRSIHGEPHTGNFMIADTGVYLIDFETVCRGPIEWDLASLPSSVAADFDGIDDELLEALRILNSIRVAIWCWASPAESMNQLGQHHLGVVRSYSKR